MFSDPLTLAIVSMITGMLLGAIASAFAVMISRDLHRDDPVYPSSVDIDEMYKWYEANYCDSCDKVDCSDCHTYDGVPENWKKGAHEK